MKKIKYKILSSLLACIVIILILETSYSVYNLKAASQVDINSNRSILYEQFDQKIKMEVETCVSVIDQFHKKQLNGEMTEEQAKKAAADVVRELRFDNGNYFWVDTTEGINVVLLGRDTEGKSRYNAQDSEGVFYVHDFISNGIKEGGGYSDYKFPRPNQTELIPKRGYTLLYKPYNWVVGTGNYLDDIEKVVKLREQEIQKKLSSQIFMLFAINLLCLVIAVMIGLFMSKKISDPIVKMAEGVRLLAQGDLRVERLDVSQKDEIGDLASGFNAMADNLRELVKRIMGSSSQLSSASEQLAAGAEQLAKAASSVAVSISDVSTGTEKQIMAVDEVSRVVENMNSVVGQIITNVKEATVVSEQTAATAQKESEEIDYTIQQMAKIEETTNHAAGLVDNLGSRSREIGQIVDTISGIAEQTNLLALNAAIEAARAGEQGKGFAVVAEEVRKLAEQSQEAAKQIADLIRQIQFDTDQAVGAMNEGTKEVRVGTASVNAAGKTFKQIAELIQDVSEKVNYAAQCLMDSAKDNQRIASAVLEVDEISREIAAQTQSVNAAVEEQTASSEEIASSSHLLMKNAEEMQDLLTRFKL
ncbi:MAG: methyl-accepting chemotaxis protein [Peptococcaceae bacterium]|nr:methyl-accepting chemotaxis protein [Peptococcaceae bacterium]